MTADSCGMFRQHRNWDLRLQGAACVLSRRVHDIAIASALVYI